MEDWLQTIVLLLTMLSSLTGIAWMMSRRFALLEAEIKALRKDVNRIEQNLTEFKAYTIKQFERVDDRFERVEIEIRGLAVSVAKLETRLDEIDKRVLRLEDAV